MIYLFSDTHFYHERIISMCNRPFSSVEEMNNIIIKRWNDTVKEEDTIFFLGDFVLGENKLDKARELERKLNGKIIFIKGNHDRKEFVIRYIEIKYKEYNFLLIHTYENPVALEYDGWVIHGHVHNNSIEKYPLINPEQRSINVSCELLGYRPISIDVIVELIKMNRKIKMIYDVQKEL